MSDDQPIELEFAPDGRLVDFLDGVLLEDRPEERVRQTFLRVLHYEYGYPREVMLREVTIMSGANPVLDQDGNPTRADIVVYLNKAAKASKDQGKIKFVVECKRPDVEAGHNQMVSYIFNTSASGGVWTNGADVQPFRRVSEPDNALEPAPGIPKQGENWDAVGRMRRDQLERPRDVRRLLQLCHNKLHSRGVDGDEEDLAMDMVRIILAKAQDEIADYPDDLPRFYVTENEYRTPQGQAEVAKRVQTLFRTFADDNPGVFSEYEKITVSDRAITEVVAVLQRSALMTRIEDADEWDVMGSAYEQYTATYLKRQRGQFFTNRRLVDFMVRALDPGPEVKALDPAGGSGGFLTAVLRHVRRKVIEGTKAATAREHQLANMRQRLFMVEVSPRLVKIAKTAMLLNGDGHSGMTRGDSLGPYDQLEDWIKARCGKGQPTLIVTNPPFAGQGEGLETDPERLMQYDVGHKWQHTANGFEKTANVVEGGCPPEMLFFERCLDWLAPGGHLGIVMPKSFLDTKTYEVARHILFRDARLLGILNCHKNTFQPHTGVRTCVVFLEKNDPSKPTPADYPIFMAICRKIGQDSEGRPIFKLDPGGTTTTEIDTDLGDILDDFHAAQKDQLTPSAYRFTVQRSEITSDLNINPQRYLPHLNDSLRRLQEIDGHEGWSVTSLAQVETGVKIYKGPRLRTENLLVEDPAEGKDVEPYYTPSAVLQDRRDSVKWLDLSRATPKQIRDFDQVRVERGDILITRSGSIGRIAYITPGLAGSIVSDDAIRIRISNPDLRAYVYAFLNSAEAQNQLLRNEYGAVQQHLEPHHVADLLIPVPDDWSKVADLISAGKAYIEHREDAEAKSAAVESAWAAAIGPLIAEAEGGETSSGD